MRSGASRPRGWRRRSAGLRAKAACSSAEWAGVPVIGLPSGLQPRAAVAYMVVSTLEVAAFAGVAPRLRTEIDGSSARLVELVAEWGPDSPPDSLAKQVAERELGSCICIYGAG